MRKPLLLLAIMTALAATVVFPAAALAVSPHLKEGVKNNPAFTDKGLTLQAEVAYAGLGNFDTLQVLTATGNPTATCTNPSGANKPPGQNPAPVTVVGTTPVNAGDIKNGNVTITTETAAPVTPIPGAPGCPGVNWTEDITNVAFTSATIQVYQDQTPGTNGPFGRWETLVLTVSCTFSPPTSDGLVPVTGRTCTVS